MAAVDSYGEATGSSATAADSADVPGTRPLADDLTATDVAFLAVPDLTLPAATDDIPDPSAGVDGDAAPVSFGEPADGDAPAAPGEEPGDEPLTSAFFPAPAPSMALTTTATTEADGKIYIPVNANNTNKSPWKKDGTEPMKGIPAVRDFVLQPMRDLSGWNGTGAPRRWARRSATRT